MRKKIGWILLWIIFLVPVTAMAVEFPFIVSDIMIAGNVEISDAEIITAVTFQIGDEIGAEQLRKSSQAIFDMGWFSEVIPEFGDGGEILFRVVENPVVRKVEITGNVNKEPFELFGFTLFRTQIMPSDKIRRILRDHGVETRQVLNNRYLSQGLEAVIDAYNEKGYPLIMVGEVVPGETLAIEIIEPRLAANRIDGLETVPAEVALGMIDLPLGEILKDAPIQRVLARLHGSVFFTDIAIVPQQGAAPDEINLLWTITEQRLIDAPIEIDGIEIAGATLFPSEVVAASIGEIPSEPLDNYGLLRVIEGLHDLYHRAGYAMARLSAGPIDGRILTLKIEEGEIGEITLEGNTLTMDFVIRKVLGLNKGEILNRERLVVAHQGLMALGYFTSVDIVPEWIDDRINLTVSLTELDRLGGISGSVAFSPASGGLVGKIDYHQKNLFGTGQDISFSFSRGLIGDESAVWNIGYSTVAFFPEFNRVGFDLYRKSDERKLGDDESQTFLTIGGRATLSYPWADFTALTLSYTHEQVKAIDDPIWQPLDSLTLGLRFDNVDRPRFPTEGSRRAISVEKAGGFAAGPDFVKLNLQSVHFFPVHLALPFFAQRDQVIATRLVLGWGEDLPLAQAYDLGGSTTVRGTDSISVQRLFYANIEYRLAIVEGLTGTLFFDSGVDLDRVSMDGAKASFGVELGIEAAGMFVRLNMAWVLGPDLGLVPRFGFGFSPMF